MTRYRGGNIGNRYCGRCAEQVPIGFEHICEKQAWEIIDKTRSMELGLQAVLNSLEPTQLKQTARNGRPIRRAIEAALNGLKGRLS